MQCVRLKRRIEGSLLSVEKLTAQGARIPIVSIFDGNHEIHYFPYEPGLEETLKKLGKVSKSTKAKAEKAFEEAKSKPIQFPNLHPTKEPPLAAVPAFSTV